MAMISNVPSISSLNSMVITSSAATGSDGVTDTTSNDASGSTVNSRSVTTIVEPASFALQWLTPTFCAFIYWPASALSIQKPFSA